MAEGSKGKDLADTAGGDATDNPQPNGRSISLAEIEAIMANAAREAAKIPPLPAEEVKGCPPDVAMSALMDIEEEGWREALLDPDLTEAERADIMAKLDANQGHRRWLNFMKTIDPPSYNPHEPPPPAPNPSSKKGKEPSS